MKNIQMKKLLISLSTVAIIAAPVAIVVACGEGSDTGYTQKAITDTWGTADKVVAGTKLAAVVSDPENPRWQLAKTELNKAGGVAGFTSQSNIVKSQQDQNTWLGTQINGMSNGSGALVIGATDQTVASAVTSAAAKFLPVVAYDRLIKAETDNYEWYVTFNNEKVGNEQGLAIANELYGQSWRTVKAVTDFVALNTGKLTTLKTMLSLAGSPDDNNAEIFYNGAMAVLRPLLAWDSNFTLLGGQTFSSVAQAGWDYGKGKTALDTELGKMSTANKTALSAILAPNDGMATLAALPALNAKGLDAKTIVITGQDSNKDALASIDNVTGVNMTIYKPDGLAARMATAVAAKLAITQKLDITTNAVVTKTDMEAYLKTAYSEIGFVIKDNDNNYKAGAKFIKTVVLDPVVLTKTNLSTYFEKK